MANQTRPGDQQRDQKVPGRDQDRNQQNMSRENRDPAEGGRSDQDRDRDWSEPHRGHGGQGGQHGQDRNDDMKDTSRR
jgi:hypothetical protein